MKPARQTNGQPAPELPRPAGALRQETADLWEQSTSELARFYISRLGLALIKIPPGRKNPVHKKWNCEEWNEKEGTGYFTDPGEAARHWQMYPLDSMGMVHGPSRTAALDGDQLEYAHIALSAVGLDLDRILAKARVKIQGNPQRAKCLFRVPQGVDLRWRKLEWQSTTVFELRAGPTQDVLPPSIHPETNRHYQWVGKLPLTREDIPELPGELLMLWQNWEALHPKMLAACPWKLEKSNGTRSGISNAVSLLESNTPIPKGRRHPALLSIAGRLRWEGKNAETIVHTLHAINRERCNPPKPDSEVNNIVAYIANKDPGNGRDHETFGKTRATVSKLLDLIFSQPWPGRAGATNREVLLAFLSISFSSGKLKITASERQIAELAGVRRETVHRSIHTLRSQKWLRLLTPGKGATANAYRLQPPGGDTNTPIPPRKGASALLVRLCHPSDAWRWSGLGKTARLVWELLGVRMWPSVRELAAALSVNERTVTRNLKKLKERKLAIREEEGWRCGEADVEIVAKSLRSYGKSEAQVRQHKQEREVYRAAYEAKKQAKNGQSKGKGKLREEPKVPEKGGNHAGQEDHHEVSRDMPGLRDTDRGVGVSAVGSGLKGDMAFSLRPDGGRNVQAGGRAASVGGAEKGSVGKRRGKGNVSLADVAAGFRVLALKHHPDRGGDHNAMVVLNEARDWLCSQIRPALEAALRDRERKELR